MHASLRSTRINFEKCGRRSLVSYVSHLQQTRPRNTPSERKLQRRASEDAVSSQPLINLQEWDIVAFRDDEVSDSNHEPACSVGRVIELVNGADCRVEVLKEGEFGPGIWTVSGEEALIAICNVCSLLDMRYEQRQLDRSVNPHMEHAEDVYILETIPDNKLVQLKNRR